MNPRQNARLLQTTWLLTGIMLILLQLAARPAPSASRTSPTVAGVRSNQLVGYGLVVGPGRHRRPDHPGALHHPEPHQHAGTPRRHAADRAPTCS